MTKDEFMELVAAEVPRDVLEQLVADDRNNLGPDYDRADDLIAEAIWNALVGKVPPWMSLAPVGDGQSRTDLSDDKDQADHSLIGPEC